ncbi:TRAP-type C4-dicarboxylate transport system substrate-binding protein [Jezberella montanilacus]|uniref:TRAP-type C4-dicarboxylate transport system substrate-binding protein n=1 Tax=Jezberella montanilacus TaxID=323426 RepID=A0A2T0XKD2_9BURK|nr:TRAP-type C4-dicarboxylate transport system substrate-binding protein [Jezberella montanilacus]
MRLSQLARLSISVACMAVSGLTFGQTKWDLASGYPPGNFHTENLEQFTKDVDAATQGKLKITLHSNASLFKLPEIKRAVQGGQAQAGEILLAAYENENALFGMDGVPFLATSYADAKKLQSVQLPALDKYLAEQGIKVLYTVPWQPQGIYSKKPLTSVADMKGMKWRSYSPSTAKMAELMQLQPVTVQAAELSQALATGIVESYISSSATGIDSKTYESLKYFYETQAWIPKNAVLVSLKAFNALDKATQDAVLKAAAEAQVRGWKISEDKEAIFKQTLRDRGMTVEAPSATFAADLNKVGGVMLGDWEKKMGADGAALISAYKK